MLWIILWTLGCGTNRSAVPVDPLEPAPLPPPAQVDRFTVMLPATRDAKWADARCNDGTPGGLGLSARQASKTWVVQVQGGFFCDDAHVMCRDREAPLTTGPAMKGVHIKDGGFYPGFAKGLLSRDAAKNPTFHDANFVQSHYCSSDFWLGDSTEKRATTGDPDGWYFSGRANLRANLELLATQGLDQADPQTKILLLGSSAGGVGVYSNLPMFQELWPDAMSQGRVRVVLDGAWLAEQPVDAMPKVNAWGGLLPACEARMVDAKKDRLNCIFGRSWYPDWKAAGVPLLIQQSGLDSTQLKAFGVKGTPALLAWQVQSRDSMRDLPWVFSGGLPYHIIATSPKVAAGPKGQRLIDVVDAFWNDKPPQRVFFRYQDAQEISPR